MSGETVLIAQSGGVTRLTLNRPDKLNAFTLAMHAELRAGLEAANADPQCRVVVLTGAGRAFSAGQDLAEMGGPTDAATPDAGSRLEKAYNPLIKLITTLEKPVICAVNGIAAGAARQHRAGLRPRVCRAQRQLPAGLRPHRARSPTPAAPGCCRASSAPRARAALPCWPSR